MICDCFFLPSEMVISYRPTEHALTHYILSTQLFISSGLARWIHSTQISGKERQNLKITLILC